MTLIYTHSWAAFLQSRVFLSEKEKWKPIERKTKWWALSYYYSLRRTGSLQSSPFTRAKKSARRAKFLAPCLVYRWGGSLGTSKILSTGATLHLGPICLHVENWECRAFKSSAIRELKMETFSGRRRPDRQRKPGTKAAVAFRQK